MRFITSCLLGDIFSCHAINNPDKESEMVISRASILQYSHDAYNKSP